MYKKRAIMHVQSCYFADLVRLFTIPDSFLAATKIISDIVSVHTQERSWRPGFCDGAKLPRADLKSGASHIGEVLCHTLEQCEHLFGPSQK